MVIMLVVSAYILLFIQICRIQLLFIKTIAITITSFPHFITNHMVFIKMNMTGATTGAGTVYPSGSTGFSPDVLRGFVTLYVCVVF